MRKEITRRQFAKSAGAGIALFNIVPRYVLGGNGYTPPSEMVRLAAIGLGGQGRSDLRELCGIRTNKGQVFPEDEGKGKNVVATCDVNQRALDMNARIFPGAAQYTDYRKMFDKLGDSIDAVVVATPDHTHAVVSLAAIRRGKHVYCEKPLAHSVHEVRVVMDEAKKYNVITQLGNQGHSSDRVKQLCEWIRDGAIGKVREIHAATAWHLTKGTPADNTYCRIDALAKLAEQHDVPKTLDWDLWLGPAYERNYHPLYGDVIWRAWTPFGTGRIGDWFCHIIDPAYWSLDLGYPVSVRAEDVAGYNPVEHQLTFPQGAKIVYEFPAKDGRDAVKIFWYEGSIAMPHPKELEADRQVPVDGAIIIGEYGGIKHGSHGAMDARIIPETHMQEYAGNMPEPSLPRVPDGNHWQEFISAVREGRKANSDFANYGGPLTECGLLGMIAMRFPGETLKYDAQNARFTNNEPANALLNPPYRRGWSL